MPSDDAPADVKVNKWDANASRYAIDDAIRKITGDRYDFIERTGLVDTRLIISFIAVGFAGFALYWDWVHPFPKSRNVLILCVVSYFLLMGVLQLFVSFVERNIFLVSIEKRNQKADRTWTFTSKMDKYSDLYRLSISVDSGAAATLEKSIACWIDDNGRVVVDVLAKDIAKLHDSLLAERKIK